MKTMLLIGIVLMLTSCGKTYTEDYSNKLETDYRVVVIDSCEYIIMVKYAGYSNDVFFTHKGNCKNPIHYQYKTDDK